jgi:hypothetical protein
MENNSLITVKKLPIYGYTRLLAYVPVSDLPERTISSIIKTPGSSRRFRLFKTGSVLYKHEYDNVSL